MMNSTNYDRGLKRISNKDHEEKNTNEEIITAYHSVLIALVESPTKNSAIWREDNNKKRNETNRKGKRKREKYDFVQYDFMFC